MQELQTDLEWKVIYVGSAESSSFDQILEELLVGPVPLGINKFILEAPAPEKKLIPSNDLLGMTLKKRWTKNTISNHDLYSKQ